MATKIEFDTIWYAETTFADNGHKIRTHYKTREKAEREIRLHFQNIGTQSYGHDYHRNVIWVGSLLVF